MSRNVSCKKFRIFYLHIFCDILLSYYICSIVQKAGLNFRITFLRARESVDGLRDGDIRGRATRSQCCTRRDSFDISCSTTRDYFTFETTSAVVGIYRSLYLSTLPLLVSRRYCARATIDRVGRDRWKFLRGDKTRTAIAIRCGDKMVNTNSRNKLLFELLLKKNYKPMSIY